MSSLEVEAEQDRFAILAKRCESLAAANPVGYRWRVVALGLLGYLFPLLAILFVAALFLAVILLSLRYFGFLGGIGGGILVVDGVIVLLFLTGIITRALSPRPEASHGILLKRSEAPELLAFIDSIGLKLGAPRIDKVFVGNELNASIRQLPRLGFFGFYRNELVLGLPLLQTLSRDELAWVIAHEFSHLANNHGKTGAWVYRSRQFMARVLESVEEKPRLGTELFRWFYRKYVPYFSAYSFALARKHEYQADQQSAIVASGKVAVDAIVRLEIAQDYIARVFWNDIWDRPGEQTEPPADVYQQLGRDLALIAEWDDAEATLRLALVQETDYSDTHPSLKDRVAALGELPLLPSSIIRSGLCLLPDHGAEQTEALSREWRSAAATAWTERHEEIAEDRTELAKLDAEALSGPLDPDSAAQRGLLAEQYLDGDAALDRYDQAVRWSDSNNTAHFLMGRLLLKLGRDDGISRIEITMERDEEFIIPGCELIETFLIRAGRNDERVAYEQRRRAQEVRLRADHLDRNRIDETDELLPHDCDDDLLAEILSAVGEWKSRGLKRAWLVRKVTEDRTWIPAIILICEVGLWRRSDAEPEEVEVALNRSLGYHSQLSIFVTDASEGWLLKKASAVPNAQIWSKSEP